MFISQNISNSEYMYTRAMKKGQYKSKQRTHLKRIFK